ncbi:prostaglandin F2-alpha receptor-like [Rhopilema esculentum]|uniref:prostaglandin F2-alpha receptor-like n=1 Tax=Rhopilema esculentum TaxID=499914 RepID=UPI0031D848F2|eukprot:gene12951-3710_t
MANISGKGWTEKEWPTVGKSSCSVHAVIYLVVQTVTIVLNLVAVVLLSKLKGYNRNTCHLVVRVLVVSDVLGAVSNLIPIALSCSGYKLTKTDVCQAFGFISTVLLLWAALIVLLMCALRYFCVVRPLFYRTHITYSIVRWILFGLLLWSAIHILLPLFHIGRFKFYSKGQYCAFEIPPKTKKDFALVHLVVWEGWCLIIIQIWLTTRMIRELRVKKKWTSRLSFQQRRGVHANGILQKGYTMMTVIIVSIFLICYIPFLTYRALTLLKLPVNESYHFYLHLLAHINPMLNPILYVSCNRGYKSALRSMLGKVCSCLAEPVRRLSITNSLNMSVFSYASREGTLSKLTRSRAGTSTTFLEVPGSKKFSLKDESEGKGVKRRRGKRNSIDVSTVGSPTRGLKKEFLFTKSRNGSIIEEVFENQHTGIQQDDPPIISAYLSSSCPVSAAQENPYVFDNLKLEQERKMRGVSISSIIYAVDNLTVHRAPSPSSNDVTLVNAGNNAAIDGDEEDDNVFLDNQGHTISPKQSR